MKNVLVLMHDDSGQEARFQAALDLTRALDGHLTCLDVSIMPEVFGDDTILCAQAEMLTEERQREQGNRTAMEARLTREDVAFDWIDVTGDLVPSLRGAADLADVIVVNRALASVGFPDMLRAAGELIVKSGKPVVAVQETASRFDAFGDVLVAWDGSSAACAALRAATPLTQHAQRVVLLEVDDGTLKTPATDAAAYLSRHGVEAVVHRVPTKGASVAEVILAELRRLRPGYLVMGGFGHSRFVEALFGGVTRRMLQECPVPLFLAH